jgi:hypothetical protein
LFFKASLTAGFFISAVNKFTVSKENTMKQIGRLTSVIFNGIMLTFLGKEAEDLLQH